MDETRYKDADLSVLDGLGKRRRPWTMTWVGLWPEGVLDRISDRIEAILECMPGVPCLTIHFEDGQYAMASRDFPSSSLDAVDMSLQHIFKTQSKVRGITFPGNEDRRQHTATPDDPYWLSTGKAAAAIQARMEAKEITPGEAIAQYKKLWDRTDAEQD